MKTLNTSINIATSANDPSYIKINTTPETYKI